MPDYSYDFSNPMAALQQALGYMGQTYQSPFFDPFQGGSGQFQQASLPNFGSQMNSLSSLYSMPSMSSLPQLQSYNSNMFADPSSYMSPMSSFLPPSYDQGFGGMQANMPSFNLQDPYSMGSMGSYGDPYSSMGGLSNLMPYSGMTPQSLGMGNYNANSNQFNPTINLGMMGGGGMGSMGSMNFGSMGSYGMQQPQMQMPQGYGSMYGMTSPGGSMMGGAGMFGQMPQGMMGGSYNTNSNQFNPMLSMGMGMGGQSPLSPSGSSTSSTSPMGGSQFADLFSGLGSYLGGSDPDLMSKLMGFLKPTPPPTQTPTQTPQTTTQPQTPTQPTAQQPLNSPLGSPVGSTTPQAPATPSTQGQTTTPAPTTAANQTPFDFNSPAFQQALTSMLPQLLTSMGYSPTPTGQSTQPQQPATAPQTPAQGTSTTTPQAPGQPPPLQSSVPQQPVGQTPQAPAPLYSNTAPTVANPNYDPSTGQYFSPDTTQPLLGGPTAQPNYGQTGYYDPSNPAASQQQQQPMLPSGAPAGVQSPQQDYAGMTGGTAPPPLPATSQDYSTPASQMQAPYSADYGGGKAGIVAPQKAATGQTATTFDQWMQNPDNAQAWNDPNWFNLTYGNQGSPSSLPVGSEPYMNDAQKQAVQPQQTPAPQTTYQKPSYDNWNQMQQWTAKPGQSSAMYKPGGNVPQQPGAAPPPPAAPPGTIKMQRQPQRNLNSRLGQPIMPTPQPTTIQNGGTAGNPANIRQGALAMQPQNNQYAQMQTRFANLGQQARAWQQSRLGGSANAQGLAGFTA
jgi:hypothetical protein